MWNYFPVLFLLFSSPLLAKPRLELLGDEWDFGKVAEGATVEHLFVLRNAGDADLKITEVRPACAPCTAFSWSKKTIPPGKSAELQVLYHAKLKVGRHSTSFVIQSNDPSGPSREVGLKISIVSAKYLPKLLLPAVKVDLGVLALGVPRETRIRVSNPELAGEPLVIKRIDGSRGVRVIRPAPKEVAPGGTETITVQVECAEGGVLNEHLTVVTNDPVHPEVAVPIQGYVSGEKELTATRDRAGVVIGPDEPLIPVPGSRGKFVGRLHIDNQTTGVVTVTFPKDARSLARAPAEPITLKRGQSESVRLELNPDRVGKTDSLSILVHYPVMVREE